LKFRRFIATFFGVGWIPTAPGTWGSLLTTLLIWPLLHAVGDNPLFWFVILLEGTLFFSILALILGQYALRDFGSKDPGPFVLDEAAGICLTLLMLPPSKGGRMILTLALGFVAFRVFDIIKPTPARNLEKLPGGWGILLDDLAAALYANLVCQIVLRMI